MLEPSTDMLSLPLSLLTISSKWRKTRGINGTGNGAIFQRYAKIIPRRRVIQEHSETLANRRHRTPETTVISLTHVPQHTQEMSQACAFWGGEGAVLREAGRMRPRSSQPAGGAPYRHWKALWTCSRGQAPRTGLGLVVTRPRNLEPPLSGHWKKGQYTRVRSSKLSGPADPKVTFEV